MNWTPDRCFRLAIASIAQCPGPRGDRPAAAGAAPARRALRHASGLTAHLFPEIAVVLSGRGRMDFRDHSHLFEPPAIFILPPGCAHCEAADSARTPYALLWLVGDGSLTTALLSNFQPGRGWRTPLRRTVRCRSSLRLFARVRAGLPAGSAFNPALRRDLLDLMVRFYESPEPPAAPRAGHSPVARHAGLLEQIRNYLDQHYAEPITLPQLATQVHLTPRYLNRLFHQWSGEALHEFLTRRRMEEALKLCRQKQRLIKEIAAAVGYDDPLYFSRAFHRYFGKRPTEM